MMTHTLSDLVTFIGQDDEWMARAKHAVEWVASKPEGMALLEEAYQLHGKPLPIIVDCDREDVGYGHDGKHMMVVNPPQIPIQYLWSKDGGIIQNSLERYFSHEFKHATQVGLLEAEPEYMAHKQPIADEEDAEKKRIISAIPLDQYKHRLQAATNAVMFFKIWDEIYHAHIGDKFAVCHERAIQALEANPVVQHVVDTFEVPAMDSENLIMGKYKGEAERAEDYHRSSLYPEGIQKMEFADMLGKLIGEKYPEIEKKLQEQMAQVQR